MITVVCHFVTVQIAITANLASIAYRKTPDFVHSGFTKYEGRGCRVTKHTKVCSRNNYANSKTWPGVWERRTRPTRSPPEPGPMTTEEEVEPVVPMLLEHDYAASRMVCRPGAV